MQLRNPVGRERLSASATIERHRHQDGYITIVLSGGYEEAGFEGRRFLVPGDAVVHHAHDAHLDRVGTLGAELLNLPLASSPALPTAFRIQDVDLVARLAERDPMEAAGSIEPGTEVHPAADWPDLLAADLKATPDLRLGVWAKGKGLAAETVSRGFASAYGTTPARFRKEIRTRNAIKLINEGGLGLADVAAYCGFADQAHLTRSTVELTGLPPSRLRKSIPFKNSRHSPA